MTTGKTIALTKWNFVSNVMCLLFNMLSRFVIAFLPRSKCLLTSWLQSPSAVILELKKIKPVTVSIVSASICHEVMGPKWYNFICIYICVYFNIYMHIHTYIHIYGASQVSLVGKSQPSNAGDLRDMDSIPWVRKIPWRRAWQSTPVYLPGESYGQRSLVRNSPRGCKGSDTTEWLNWTE